MKILIDAHLPKRLNLCFKGYDVIHTSELPEGNLTSDQYINELSMKENLVVITKDSDFYYSYVSSKVPYKPVFVKVGNMRLTELVNYFEKNADVIINLLKNYSYIVIQKDKIRALD